MPHVEGHTTKNTNQEYKRTDEDHEEGTFAAHCLMEAKLKCNIERNMENVEDAVRE